MDKDKFLQTGLLEQYVLGLTDEEENETVEAYADAYPEIKQEIQTMRSALDEYAQQYAVMPPKELKKRVMKSLDGEAKQDGSLRSGGRSSFSRVFSGVAIVLLGILGVLAASFYKGKTAAQEQYHALEAEFQRFKEDCASEKARLQQTQHIYAFMNAPKTLVVPLGGTAMEPEARAIAYYNAESQKAYINTSNLPAPPKGKTYQLWADVEGEMISMGVIEQQPEPQPVQYVDHAESLNITLEPEGGSEEPTVELLLANGLIG
ncbi:MAG: hypothetical protein GVY26_17500 [Bacteroidetes bacterium]|jgi:anti-sigma-K factor RskA|nr:hypothetical protein [Bacteroidota bacterium]